MPELPEVDSYRVDMSEMLTGRRFAEVYVDWPNQVVTPAVDEFAGRLMGQTVESVGRRGKYLLFHLSQDDTLIIHLKMSGRLLVEPISAPPDKHAHVVFRLDDGDELRFCDPRKFGRVYLVRDVADVVGRLGPEPLEHGFTVAWLEEALAGRSRRIKSLLLDQSFVAGLGNIYVDESLHRAGVHPLRPANTLTEIEVEKLHQAIQLTLREAIANRGTSFDQFYLDARGKPGAYQTQLLVYNRAGEPCFQCGTPIERIVVSQRGTHVCLCCQPAHV